MFWIAIGGLIITSAGVLIGSWVHQGRIQRMERRILLLASQKGRITFVDVVKDCDMPPDLARQLLDDMGLKGHLSPQVTKDGAMVYRLVDAGAEERAAAQPTGTSAGPAANPSPGSREDDRPEQKRESVR